jgi:molybdopterin/thiamine biosynthesis adenylyltransferase
MINPLRHQSVFSPDEFGDRRVDVIGVGATGSHLVTDLVRLGIKHIHVWDHDEVVDHNRANQAYGEADVGKSKVKAIAEIAKAICGVDIVQHEEKVDGSQTLGEIVFLLTDTMDSRKEIWEKGIRYRINVNLMIETRMGASEGRIYVIKPLDPDHVKGWEGTLYAPGTEVQLSLCGASTTVGPTAKVLAGLAVWQLIRWFSIERGKEDQLDNEIIFSIVPLGFYMRKF